MMLFRFAGIEESCKLESETSAIFGQTYFLKILGMPRGLELSIAREPMFFSARRELVFNVSFVSIKVVFAIA